MKKISILLLGLLLAFTFAACDFGGGPAGTQGQSGGDVKLSDATDRWPSGVYNAYNVPEYKSGKVIYAQPQDQYGSVYIKTTRDEFNTYIEQLKSAGFRFEKYAEEEMQRNWGSFKAYFPQSGSGYALCVLFSYEEDGKGICTEIYDDNTDETFDVWYNLSLYIYDGGKTQRNIPANMLADIGVQGDSFVADIVKEAAMQVLSVEPYYAMGGLGFDFDFELNEEVFRVCVDKLIDAFAAASDSGKLADLSGQEKDAAAAKSEKWSSWMYTHNGTKYMVIILAESGYGEGIAISVQEYTGE